MKIVRWFKEWLTAFRTAGVINEVYLFDSTLQGRKIDMLLSRVKLLKDMGNDIETEYRNLRGEIAKSNISDGAKRYLRKRVEHTLWGEKN